MQAVISYLVFFLILVAIFLLILKARFFKDKHISRKFICIAFIVKIMAAGGLIYIYSHHYHDRTHTDIFKYYDDGLVFNKIIKNHPKDAVKMFFEDTKNNHTYFVHKYFDEMNHWNHKAGTAGFSEHNMIKLNALLTFISAGFYLTHILLFLFIAFCGLWLIYKAIKQFFMGKEWLLFIIIFLLPELLIWTSGVLKESILIMGMGLFLNAVFLIKNAARKIGCFLLVAILFYWFRSFMLALLLVSLPFAYYKKIKNYWLVGVLILYAACFVYFLSNGFLISHLIQERGLFLFTAKTANAGSLVLPPTLSHSFLSLLFNIPFALKITFFYPLIWQIHSVLAIIPALENVFFFIVLIISFFFLRKIPKPEQRFLAFCLVFIFANYITIGLVCPIVGAVIRYKIFAFLLLFVLPLFFLDKNKLLKIFKPYEVKK